MVELDGGLVNVHYFDPPQAFVHRFRVFVQICFDVHNPLQTQIIEKLPNSREICFPHRNGRIFEDRPVAELALAQSFFGLFSGDCHRHLSGNKAQDG